MEEERACDSSPHESNQRQLKNKTPMERTRMEQPSGGKEKGGRGEEEEEGIMKDCSGTCACEPGRSWVLMGGEGRLCASVNL